MNDAETKYRSLVDFDKKLDKPVHRGRTIRRSIPTKQYMQVDEEVWKWKIVWYFWDFLFNKF